MKNRKKTLKSDVGKYGYLIGVFLLILSPVLQLVVFDRYYDIEQFFVSDSYNYDIGRYVEIGEEDVLQMFTAREDRLAGLDLQLSGKKDYVEWSLEDSDGNEIRSGQLKNSGESKISSIRFEPIENSNSKRFFLHLGLNEKYKGVKISYSSKANCTDCSLSIDSIDIDANLNSVPVYKAASVKGFLQIVRERVMSID